MNSGTTRKPTKAELDAAVERTARHRHDRLPAHGGRVAALRMLHSQLASNAALYEKGDRQDQRDAVAASLLAVTKFLARQGFSVAVLAPIMRPVEALAEREGNSLDPMFTERVRNGRPAAKQSDYQRAGILAALTGAWLELMADDGRKQDQKLDELVRQMRGGWFAGVSKAKLKQARELVSQESNNHPAVRHARIYNRHLLKAAERHGPRNGIEIMIHFLNSTPPLPGLGHPIWKTPHVSPTEDD